MRGPRGPRDGPSGSSQGAEGRAGTVGSSDGALARGARDIGGLAGRRPGVDTRRMSGAAPTIDHEAAIRATCTDYVASWLDGNADRMAACLQPGLAKRSVGDPTTGSLGLDEDTYDSMIASAGRGPRQYGRDLRIVVHDISDGIASASVLSEPWLDLVHLAWFGDRWRIVNVVYEPRATSGDDPADRVAVADLLGAYARSGFDADLDLVLATCHPELAERRVIVGDDGARILEDTSRDEVVEAVRQGLDLERFERAWQGQVFEVGHDIASAKMTMGWWDMEIHAGRFGERWRVVNVLYRSLPVDP
jgi:hypothetical protein